jgi:Ca2+/Na+ antiporter
MVVLSLILLPFAISGKHRISRIEGVVFLILYTGYILWRAFYFQVP